MFDLSVVLDYPELCDQFVRAEYEFLELKNCNRVGWWRLNLIPVMKHDRYFFNHPRPEDDLQHTAHCTYLAMLLETHFGVYMQNVDFHALMQSMLLHEICEVTTGDTPSTDGDMAERRAKKANDELLTADYIRRNFPSESHGPLLAANHVFNNVDRRYCGFNHGGVVDASAFVFNIAWGMQSPRARIEDKMYLEMATICQNPNDQEHIELAGTPYAIDAVYAGLLLGELKGYFYAPIIIALAEAHYRSINRRVPASLKELYPYYIS